MCSNERRNRYIIIAEIALERQLIIWTHCYRREAYQLLFRLCSTATLSMPGESIQKSKDAFKRSRFIRPTFDKMQTFWDFLFITCIRYTLELISYFRSILTPSLL